MKFIDLSGKRFGRLTAISKEKNSICGKTQWKCMCDCGKTLVVLSNELRRKHTKSCGCLRIELLKKRVTTHGKTNSPIYKTWEEMMKRTKNPNSTRYSYYGGRGIKVCKRWQKFENFYLDMGDKPNVDYSIDRIDNNGNYELGNCRWANKSVQARNQRTRITNKSGYKGVFWDKKIKKWCSYITRNYKRFHLGFFNNLGEAVKQREMAEIKYWN